MTNHERLEPEEVQKIVKENDRLIGNRRITLTLIQSNPNLRRMNIVANHIKEVHGQGVLGSEWPQLVAQHTKALKTSEIDLEDLI